MLRTSLLPGVVQAVAGNLRRGVEDVRLFELGRAFWEGERRGPVPGSTKDGADARLTPLPGEPLLLAAAATAAAEAEAATRIRDLQAVVTRLAADLGAGSRWRPGLPMFRACARSVRDAWSATGRTSAWSVSSTPRHRAVRAARPGRRRGDPARRADPGHPGSPALPGTSAPPGRGPGPVGHRPGRGAGR